MANYLFLFRWHVALSFNSFGYYTPPCRFGKPEEQKNRPKLPVINKVTNL